ncbi:MAG: hypothetical protein ACK4TP_10150 [Hyphomicrobium sp.]
MAEDFEALHKRIVEEAVEKIAKEPIAAGHGVDEILIVLEGVIVGVMTLCIKPWGDEEVLAMVMRGASRRLAEDRQRRRTYAETGL